MAARTRLDVTLYVLCLSWVFLTGKVTGSTEFVSLALVLTIVERIMLR